MSRTGPNQTLEEIRPAVTTSPKTRRSGGRPSAHPPQRSRRQRTTPRATSRGQRASCATSGVHRLDQRRPSSTCMRNILRRQHPASVALLARSGARPTKQQRREAALPAVGHRATICARLRGLRRDQARNVPATMRDGCASFGRHARDKRASSARCGAAACGGAGQSTCDDISAVLI
ncbi:hypothetical protein F511_45704 [Dorcoceras hygrometricum]|uniref:Uncharacterized protein n=1 Tax=Dorcoceras hygrometricum TaxID=472368 RepID=A0A2Z6ZWH2_9LAMI|nr:hypothetical protein F511_45704 [Dorcoceras hygrometricum]